MYLLERSLFLCLSGSEICLASRVVKTLRGWQKVSVEGNIPGNSLGSFVVRTNSICLYFRHCVNLDLQFRSNCVDAFHLLDLPASVIVYQLDRFNLQFTRWSWCFLCCKLNSFWQNDLRLWKWYDSTRSGNRSPAVTRNDSHSGNFTVMWAQRGSWDTTRLWQENTRRGFVVSVASWFAAEKQRVVEILSEGGNISPVNAVQGGDMP